MEGKDVVLITHFELNKEEAIKWIVETKEISAFTRNFVEWLYREDKGVIIRQHEGTIKGDST